MPSLSIKVPHALGQDRAVARLKEQFRTIKEAYQDQVSSLEEQWDGNAMRFRFGVRGVTVAGTVAIDPSEVAIRAQLPLVAMVFKAKIEAQIRERLRQMLA